eukprot:scaffold11923_cov18-Tisochrysis_lutea.AAC.5
MVYSQSAKKSTTTALSPASARALFQSSVLCVMCNAGGERHWVQEQTHTQDGCSGAHRACRLCTSVGCGVRGSPSPPPVTDPGTRGHACDLP